MRPDHLEAIIAAQIVKATYSFILNTFAVEDASKNGMNVKTAIEMATKVANVSDCMEAPNAIATMMIADRKPQPARAGTIGLKILATVSKNSVRPAPFLPLRSSLSAFAS